MPDLLIFHHEMLSVAGKRDCSKHVLKSVQYSSASVSIYYLNAVCICIFIDVLLLFLFIFCFYFMCTQYTIS